MRIQSEDDVYHALGLARTLMKQLVLSDTEQQMILVSVSELTRNILDHAGGKGNFYCERIDGGIRVEVADEGPGIENLEEILHRHYAHQSSRGLGLGLAGVNRLMDEVVVETSARGTRIIAKKWV